MDERQAQSPAGINPRLIFKLKIHPGSHLSDDDLRPSGLRIVAREPDNAIVVFPDDLALSEFRRRIKEYAGVVSNAHKYEFVSRIDGLAELTSGDRTGPRLRKNPLLEGEIAKLDVELWHPGSREECYELVDELQRTMDGQEFAVKDQFIGTDICLLRVMVDSTALYAPLNVTVVKEVDRRPKPSFEVSDVHALSVSDLTIGAPALEQLVGVLVLDSGVMQSHPLLAPIIGDAQVFPDQLRQKVVGGAEDGDTATGGHGTAVAGFAAYGDFTTALNTRKFEATASLFSARVTDDKNEYDEDELIEHQLASALKYFLDNYSMIHVVNISLGDQTLAFRPGSKQLRLAAVIDDLAFQYREREVLFVVSAGNFDPVGLDDEDVVQRYPDYLVDDGEAHIIDPATSAIALTVGGLSQGPALSALWNYEDQIDRLVARSPDYPSPFTRTGFGVDDSIKPDFVSYAGDWRIHQGRILRRTAAHAGVPTASKDFAPPEANLFRTVAGTSFAAPQIANLAARLFHAFPQASSNLIRALIADSARVPDDRPGRFKGLDAWNDLILRTYGYGLPDYDCARWSALNDVLLLSDSAIQVGSFRLYEIPHLPPEFLTAKGKGYLSVSLAFDPPTRRSRADSYLGVTMEFALYKNVTIDAVADAFRAWEVDEADNDSDMPSVSRLKGQVDLKPGTRRRSKGTLQRGQARISSTNWIYEGGPLVVAVTCRRSKWLSADVTSQRFAIVVSVSHDNTELDLYAHIRQQARLHQRVRVRV